MKNSELLKYYSPPRIFSKPTIAFSPPQHSQSSLIPGFLKVSKTSSHCSEALRFLDVSDSIRYCSGPPLKMPCMFQDVIFFFFNIYLFPFLHLIHSPSSCISFTGVGLTTPNPTLLLGAVFIPLTKSAIPKPKLHPCPAVSFPFLLKVQCIQPVDFAR